jgi:adenosylcobyric acid synthase
MKKLAACLMVQGTASDVGKSVIATALCRVLADRGLRVAPFKGQNMSLNAAVTASGGEIGRAQAAQADAARVVAQVEMNPVLLKPESEGRSQVIVLGRPTGSRSAREYWSGRAALWPIVRSALRTLRQEFDVVVIEGAGSPAEMNLRRTDLANMRVAAAADATVALVGDIERGGVFAQLLGTLALLPPTDRARVRGLLVNKFRGDPTLFDSGVRYLQARSRRPVIGVLPHDPSLQVPPEDDFGLRDSPPAGGLDIAVVRLPHIANFDDFTPLAEAGVGVRYVSGPETLGVPDLVVLPGSKTTIADLEWLRATGLAARIRSLIDAGVPVLGICGGFQMLGRELHDPAGIEGPVPYINGLGLLNITTVFRPAKSTVPVTGVVRHGGALFGDCEETELSGYELHCGQTSEPSRDFATLRRPNGELVTDGAVSPDGRILGTYLHGLLANRGLRDALIRSLAVRRGIAPPPDVTPADRYAHLAAWFCASADVPWILRTLGLDG